jgi:hypothetical protein
MPSIGAAEADLQGPTVTVSVSIAGDGPRIPFFLLRAPA